MRNIIFCRLFSKEKGHFVFPSLLLAPAIWSGCGITSSFPCARLAASRGYIYPVLLISKQIVCPRGTLLLPPVRTVQMSSFCAVGLLFQLKSSGGVDEREDEDDDAQWTRNWKWIIIRAPVFLFLLLSCVVDGRPPTSPFTEFIQLTTTSLQLSLHTFPLTLKTPVDDRLLLLLCRQVHTFQSSREK